MKIATRLFLALLVISGCQKDPHTATPTTRRIASISGFGEVSWNGGELQSAAGAKLTYTGSRLTGLRRETRDTTFTVSGSDTLRRMTYSLLQYSFDWMNGKIHAVHLDSSVSNIVSGLDVYYSMSTGGTPCTYFYTGDRLDSVVYTTSRAGLYQKITDQYDGTGNIRTQIVFDYGSGLTGGLIFGTAGPGQFPPSSILPTESITTFTYDGHPNPWNLLFTQVKVALPGMEDRNFSRNNPLTADIDLTPGVTTDAHKTVIWLYEYDAAGYPVSISSSEGGEVTRIRYQ